MNWKKIEENSIYIFTRKSRKKRRGKWRKARVERFRVKSLKNPTEAEAKFGKLLTDNGIRYESQKVIKCGQRYYIVDFYLTDYRIIVEVDGEYHEDPEQKARDEERQGRLLGKQHIRKLVRFTNDQVMLQPKDVLKRLVVAICPAAVLFIVK